MSQYKQNKITQLASSVGYPTLGVKPINTHNTNWVTDAIALALFIFIFYMLWLGSYPVFTPDEGRYSEIAREMIASGDYITPRINGIPFLDKPILYYWLQTIAIHLFGIKEWALRLFPVLSSVLGCLITYICGRQLFDRRTGLIAAILLATSPLYFGNAHYANLDLELAVFVSAALCCFITALHQKPIRLSFLYAGYFFAALAFLTKGLIGIVFPIAIIGSWMLLTRQLSLIKSIHLFRGILLCFAIIFPWYFLAQKANPEFLHYFFITQQVTRFLSHAEFNNQAPFWFYVPIILIGFFPWTICLFQSLIRVRTEIEIFLLLWIVIILVFFSIPHSKIITYILPIFPALSLLTARYLTHTWISHRGYTQAFLLICITINVLFLLALVQNAKYLNQDSAKPLVEKLKLMIQPQDEVASYFNYYQDVPLYLGRRISIAADWQDKNIPNKDNWMRELGSSQTSQQKLISENEFWKRWHSQKKMYVFVSKKYLAAFTARHLDYNLIGQTNDIYLLSNAKNPPLTRDKGKDG